MTRRLWKLDNLEGLARLPTGSVGLAYLDPPFNSGRSYETVMTAAGATAPASQVAFSDEWVWSNDSPRLMNALREQTSKATADFVLSLIKTLGRCSLTAYLMMMAPRLAEVHRVLREDGSLYVHCDPSASHYLKILLDHLFGSENFRNEIIWKRTHAHSSSRRYGPVHDTILFYSKTGRYFWNPIYSDYTEEYLEKHYRNSDEAGSYQLITCTAPGDRAGTRAHYVWRGKLPPPGRHWAWRREQMEAFEREGRLVHSANGVPRLKRYVGEGKGVPAQDLWLDINRLDATSAERTGYETQKPAALLERILLASSRKGDLVLDPFAGSGTTAVVAERLGRGWVIMDNALMACSIALARVRQEVNLGRVVLEGFPIDVGAARQLLRAEPFAFGTWASSMLATVPDKKETNATVVIGTGNLGLRAKTVELLSWVPLRGRLEMAVPSSSGKRLSKMGLILRYDSAAAAARKWIEKRINVPLHEIELEDLVDKDSVKNGCSSKVVALARTG